MDFAIPADHTLKLKESKKRDRCCWRTEKTMEHESDSDTICKWHARYNH